MSRETDLAALLRMENRILEAMIDVRYAVEAGEKPAPAKLDAIRKVSATFADMAVVIHQKQKEEEERRDRDD